MLCKLQADRVSRVHSKTGVAVALTYRNKERGIVDDVIKTTNGKCCATYRMRVRYTRRIETGDKFASRHG